jgi:predicted  nucleic acid-binding Zn-ribbon protein
MSDAKEQYLENKKNQAELRKMKNRLEKCKKEAESAEKELEEISALMEQNATDYQALSELTVRQEALEEKLMELYEEIEELTSKLA